MKAFAVVTVHAEEAVSLISKGFYHECNFFGCCCFEMFN